MHFEYLILVFSGYHYFYVSLNCIMKFPCVIFCFALATLNILFSSLAFISLSIMCLGEAWFLVYPTWDSLQYLDLKVNTFHQICQDFSHFFCKFFSWPLFFSLPSETTIIHLLKNLILSHNSLRFYLFRFRHFSFCSLGWLISINLLQLFFSSVISSMWFTNLVNSLQLLYFPALQLATGSFF